MAALTKRVTTSGSERETQDAAQRVAADLFAQGFVITKTGAPFKDAEHTSSPDGEGFWSIDLEYDKAENVTEAVPEAETVPTPAEAPAPVEPTPAPAPEPVADPAPTEVEATPPPTAPSSDAR